MAGWIKLHRVLLEKAIWKASTPEQKTIFITLLLMANHDLNEWEWKGKKFSIKSGQFITSLDGIKKKAGKNIKTQNIRSAIKRFEKYDFLTNESTKTGRLITICNWNRYQLILNDTNIEGNKEVTKSQQRGNKALTPNKNDKNDKNDKNKEEQNSWFNEFWSIYPRKVGKKTALKYWLKNINERKEVDKIIEAVRNQRRLKMLNPENGYKYCPHPTTWLNNERWNDKYCELLKCNKCGTIVTVYEDEDNECPTCDGVLR